MPSSSNIPHIYGKAEFVGASDWNALQNREFGVSVKTANYTLAISDKNIVLNGASASVTTTLPASPILGQYYDISCIDDTFDCYIDPNGNDIFDSPDIEQIFKGENISLRWIGDRWVTA